MGLNHSFEQVVVKNASANLLRLVGSGIVALLLPPLLVRMLSPETYGAWALLLQLTLYVTYLDLGIQTAVSRFIAHAHELNDSEECDRTVSTAFAMLLLAAVLGIVLTIALSWKLSDVFHGMPHELYRPARIALVLMGCSLAIGLPVSVISSLFMGIQRNEIPAAIAVTNKFAMAVFVVSVVIQHWGLAAMGAAVAV